MLITGIVFNHFHQGQLFIPKTSDTKTIRKSIFVPDFSIHQSVRFENNLILKLFEIVFDNFELSLGNKK